jgi:hypothetical protein
MEPLITLLIYLIIGGVILYLAQMVLAIFPWPAPIKTVILVVLSLVLLLWILQTLGIFVL